MTPCCIDDLSCQEVERCSILLNNTICYEACSVSKEGEPKLASWGILSVLDYLLFLCLLISLTCFCFCFFLQPAARKGADKSGPGAGFTVLSEKTLFLGQKVSIQQKEYFSNSEPRKCYLCFTHSYIDQMETKLTLHFNVAQFYFVYTNKSLSRKK